MSTVSFYSCVRARAALQKTESFFASKRLHLPREQLFKFKWHHCILGKCLCLQSDCVRFSRILKIHFKLNQTKTSLGFHGLLKKPVTRWKRKSRCRSEFEFTRSFYFSHGSGKNLWTQCTEYYMNCVLATILLPFALLLHCCREGAHSFGKI